MWPGNTPEENTILILTILIRLFFLRIPIYGLNSKENILLGLNSRIKIYRFAQFFGQLALDNMDADVSAHNNYAFQIGFKHFDLFHQKLRNHTLFVHAEFNFISPYTYAYKNVQQSYSHYNQPITHPNGSGLKELLATAKYSFKDFSLEFRGSYLINSIDTTSTNFGSNIFLPNEIQTGTLSHTGNTPGQGIKMN
ncbi:MAG: hypothetical protein HC831_31440 [Chloroflexia bacterium]|nr:hypothetical protein [Chloroflexia bacterium]